MSKKCQLCPPEAREEVSRWTCMSWPLCLTSLVTDPLLFFASAPAFHGTHGESAATPGL